MRCCHLAVVAVLGSPAFVVGQTVAGRASAGQCHGLPGATCGAPAHAAGRGTPQTAGRPSPVTSPHEAEFTTQRCNLKASQGGHAETADCLIDRNGHLRLALFPATAKYPGGHAAVFHWQPEKQRPIKTKVVVLDMPGALAQDPRLRGLPPNIYRRLLDEVTPRRQRAAARATRPGEARSASLNPDGYTYDPNGNLTADPDGTRYQYDLESRLTKVTRADGTVLEHLYDADGNLVRKTTRRPGQAPEVVDYLVDTSGALPQVLAETDGVTGPLRTAYVRTDGGELLSVLRPSATGGYDTRHVHADYLGSVRALTDEAGQLTDRYEYTAAGELLSHSGTDGQPYGFAGEARDSDTALYYNRARWFSPRLGRFLSMDTHQGRQDDPLSLHRYLYAASDPVNKTDPTGHDFSLSVSLTSFAISNTINAISLPIARAMIQSASHIELLPVTLRSPPAPPGVYSQPYLGWNQGETEYQLKKAMDLWGTHGFRVLKGHETQVATSLLDVRDPVAGMIGDLLSAGQLTPWSPAQIPVVFARSVHHDGADRSGVAVVADTPNRHPARLALSQQLANDFTLAHELGHAFGLPNVTQPGRLMYEGIGKGSLVPTGSLLLRDEITIARKNYWLRLGGARQ